MLTSLVATTKGAKTDCYSFTFDSPEIAVTKKNLVERVVSNKPARQKKIRPHGHFFFFAIVKSKLLAGKKNKQIVHPPRPEGLDVSAPVSREESRHGTQKRPPNEMQQQDVTH